MARFFACLSASRAAALLVDVDEATRTDAEEEEEAPNDGIADSLRGSHVADVCFAGVDVVFAVATEETGSFLDGVRPAVDVATAVAFAADTGTGSFLDGVRTEPPAAPATICTGLTSCDLNVASSWALLQAVGTGRADLLANRKKETSVFSYSRLD